MVSSKMAASVLRRCAAAAVKVKCLSPSLSARRWLLSAAYTDPKMWEAREKDPQNLAVLANTMDKAHDKNLPVSSLTISQFVDNISSREEVHQSEYYLYKFRHSPNCHLDSWTVHSWIRQCLKYGARDKAMYTLKNKVQFGIFPDAYAFNLLIDSFIKDGDFKSACSVVEEVMLQEEFYLTSTQILSLYALGSYLATRPQLTVSEERALGASLLMCASSQEIPIGLSAELLGNAFLGKVEILKGIHAVFKGMPLSWERGYLGRALAVMKFVAEGSAQYKLTKDTLEYVNDLLQELTLTSESDSSGEESGSEEDKKEDTVDEDDQAEAAKLPEYVSRFKELRSQLESQGKVESASFLGLVTTVAQQDLADAEKLDLESYESRIQDWEAERRQDPESDDE